MEEFIENFNEFRTWLYDKIEKSEVKGDDSLAEVLEKFRELGLHNAF